MTDCASGSYDGFCCWLAASENAGIIRVTVRLTWWSKRRLCTARCRHATPLPTPSPLLSLVFHSTHFYCTPLGHSNPSSSPFLIPPIHPRVAASSPSHSLPPTWLQRANSPSRPRRQKPNRLHNLLSLLSNSSLSQRLCTLHAVGLVRNRHTSFTLPQRHVQPRATDGAIFDHPLDTPRLGRRFA